MKFALKPVLEFTRKVAKMYRNGLFWEQTNVNSFSSRPCLRSLEHCVDLTPLTVFVDFYLMVLSAEDFSFLWEMLHWEGLLPLSYAVPLVWLYLAHIMEMCHPKSIDGRLTFNIYTVSYHLKIILAIITLFLMIWELTIHLILCLSIILALEKTNHQAICTIMQINSARCTIETVIK